MELILLRHGKAEDHRPGDDFSRRLVEKGVRQARRAGELLAKLDRLPEVVLTSPRIRAKETAAAFCQAAGLPEPLLQGWLDSGMAPEEAIRELAAFTQFQRVMIVGHEPDFSMLVETWLGSRGAVEVKKGSLVGLQVSPPGRSAMLLYAVPPKMIDP